MTTERPDCTECGGAWLYGLTHQHRVTCPRYVAESATIDADFRRWAGVRQPTETEQLIILEHEYVKHAEDQYFVQFEHAGLHRRTVLTGPGDIEPQPDGLIRWQRGLEPAERAGTD